jgi:hypothetical protein
MWEATIFLAASIDHLFRSIKEPRRCVHYFCYSIENSFVSPEGTATLPVGKDECVDMKKPARDCSTAGSVVRRCRPFATRANLLGIEKWVSKWEFQVLGATFSHKARN